MLTLWRFIYRQRHSSAASVTKMEVFFVTCPECSWRGIHTFFYMDMSQVVILSDDQGKSGLTISKEVVPVWGWHLCKLQDLKTEISRGTLYRTWTASVFIAKALIQVTQRSHCCIWHMCICLSAQPMQQTLLFLHIWLYQLVGCCSCMLASKSAWRQCSSTTCHGLKFSFSRKPSTFCVSAVRLSCTPMYLPSTCAKTTSQLYLRYDYVYRCLEIFINVFFYKHIG